MTEPRSFHTKSPVPFEIDGEQFTVVAAIPAAELADLYDLQQSIAGEGKELREQLEGIKSILSRAMVGDSWERFEPKMSDRQNPVDFSLLLEITNWLSGEVWTARPTQSPTPSTESPESSGETSTDGAPPSESTPSESTADPVSVAAGISTSSGTG